ncbi:condensation domain-containing protein [Streptomyces sp. NPDC088348]|uniref:condensation domain-containing protein n=1 Tax=Streptomyces sp. NPDC088348 TaxID=3365853 RepID=UPI0038070421
MLMDAGPEPHGRRDARMVADFARRFWQDLLHVPGVDDDAHFFSLGGHSMLATRLMSRMRKALDADLPAGLIFDHPVFADFVTRTTAALGEDPATADERPRARGRVTGPVSPQQEQLLRIEDALGPSPVHNIVVPITLDSPVDGGVLRLALHALLNRHGALRLAFPIRDEDSAHQQVIVPPWTPADVELVERDLPAGTEGRGEDAVILKDVRRAHLKPFDLMRGNLLRAQLFRRRHAADLLVLHLHHLAVDGVSQTVLLDDLAEAYTQLVTEGRAHATDSDAPNHVDYALDRTGRQDGPAADSRRHWTGVARDLAADLAVAAEPAPRGMRYVRRGAELDTSALRGLRAWAGAEGATDFVVVTAAVATALGALLGRRHIGVGTLLDNRAHAAHERTVGPFANSTLLAVPVPSGATPRDIVRATQGRLAEARRCADSPLDDLLGPPCATLGLHPDDLVDAVVAFDRPYQAPPDSVLRMSPMYDHGGLLVPSALGPRLNVSLFAHDTGTLRVTVEHAEDPEDPQRPDAVLSAVVDTLRLFAAAPDVSVAPSPSMVPR